MGCMGVLVKKTSTRHTERPKVNVIKKTQRKYGEIGWRKQKNCIMSVSVGS